MSALSPHLLSVPRSTSTAEDGYEVDGAENHNGGGGGELGFSARARVFMRHMPPRTRARASSSSS